MNYCLEIRGNSDKTNKESYTSYKCIIFCPTANEILHTLPTVKCHDLIELRTALTMYKAYIKLHPTSASSRQV